MSDPVYQRVVSTLTEEADLLDELHYRHHVCLLLLGIGDATYLGVALAALASAEDQLARVGLLRAAAVAELALRWDLEPGSARLRDLIARADETTGPALERLSERLRAATVDLAATRELVTALTGAHLDEVRRRRDDGEQGPAEGYDRAGRAFRSASPGRRIHA